MPPNPLTSARSPDGILIVPEATIASPVDLPAQPLDALSPDFMTMFDRDMPWWRPGALDVAKVIGWRWILLAPILLAIAVLPLSFVFMPTTALQFLGTEIKIVGLGIGGAVTIVLWALRNAVKARKDMFCIHCGYQLEGLAPSGTCPECGRNYVFDVIAEFKKDPHFFAERFRALRSAPRYPAFTAGDGPTPWDGAS